MLNNNKGISHLTSPMNYVKDETIKNIVSENKAFLLKSLDKYQERLKSLHPSMPTSPLLRKKPKFESKQLKLESLR